MSRFHSYLNSSTSILSEYSGKEPFSLFLKSVFRKNKKYGSRDRRIISHLCYCYFRLGKSLMDVPKEERILMGLFLVSQEPNQVLEALKPEWVDKVTSSIAEKKRFLGIETELEQLFPYRSGLSEGIASDEFSDSFLTQPNVFVRIRPGFKETVLNKLKSHDIQFEIVGEQASSVSPNTKLDQILVLDKEAVIQDWSSQQVGNELFELFQTLKQVQGDPLRVWDCCAGSGGKSIMAFDLNNSIQLTVSDVRSSILNNLRNRFKKAGINRYDELTADLSKPINDIPNHPFDIIIADVPCTGSGTWSRTPEQFHYFDESRIEWYATLQRSIVVNSMAHLKRDGYLVYITCSVFKEENEMNIERLLSKYELDLIAQKVIPGYNERADSMFISILSHAQL